MSGTKGKIIIGKIILGLFLLFVGCFSLFFSIEPVYYEGRVNYQSINAFGVFLSEIFSIIGILLVYLGIAKKKTKPVKGKKAEKPSKGKQGIYCPKCGAKLKEGAKYCHECGEKVK